MIVFLYYCDYTFYDFVNNFIQFWRIEFLCTKFSKQINLIFPFKLSAKKNDHVNIFCFVRRKFINYQNCTYILLIQLKNSLIYFLWALNIILDINSSLFDHNIFAWSCTFCSTVLYRNKYNNIEVKKNVLKRLAANLFYREDIKITRIKNEY